MNVYQSAIPALIVIIPLLTAIALPIVGL